MLGGGWHKSNWDGREGLVFRTEAHARSFMHENTEGWYRKVSLLECMAEVYNEDLQRGESAKFDPKLLWRSLVNASRELLDASASEEHFRRGPNNGENDESYPCCITEYLAQSENKKQHKKFEKLEDGTIRIPAIGFDKKKNVDAHQSFEGGFQIHLKDKAEVEYKMPDIVSDQDYELVAKICNVHLAHEQDRLCVHVNDETVKGASIPLLYTIGDWRFTAPIQVHLNCGDVLKITREVFTGKAWGLTIREFLLMPC